MLRINGDFPIPLGRHALVDTRSTALHQQIPMNIPLNAAPHLQLVEPLESRLIGPLHAPPRRLIAFPWLRFDHHQPRHLVHTPQKPKQSRVAMVQMNPHGQRHAKGRIETRRHTERSQMRVQHRMRVVPRNVQTFVGDCVGMLVVMVGALDQCGVNVDAQNVDGFGNVLGQEHGEELGEIARIAANVEHHE